MKLPAAAALAIAFLALVPAAAMASTLDESQLLATARAAVEADNIQPIRDIESRSLFAAHGRAKRTGDTLTLALALGMTRTYQDRPECRPGGVDEARCETYRLVTWLGRHNEALVAHLTYEDLGFILVDGQNGRETELAALSAFSPSGEYVLVLDNDINNGSEIQLWERRNGVLTLSSKGAPNPDATYTLESWLEDETILIRAETDDGDERLTLQHTAAGWSVTSE